MNLLPKIRTRYGTSIGVEIFCSFPDLTDDQRSFLNADVASGASSISSDGINFSVGQYIVIGQPGNIGTEIIRIHASTVPTATTITLASALKFPHNRGDIVRFIPYNQINIYGSDNGGVSYSSIAIVDIRADSTETYYNRTTGSSASLYYFVFYNSSTTNISGASDAVLASGFADNTFGAVKRRALKQLGEEINAVITDEFLSGALLEARRWADNNPAVFRWSFRTKFGSNIGPMVAGQWRIQVPSDLRDPNTNKNILSIRIGDQNRPVVYQDRVRFNQNYLNVVHTTIAVQQTSGGTTLVLNSTNDLPPAGGLYIANDDVGQGLIAIAYTSNDKGSATLSGVTGINRTVLVDTDVWLRAVFGLPTAYTIDAGYVYFDVPLKIDYDGMDIKMDYYSTIPGTTDEDSGVFDEPFYDLYVPWLRWKIKYLKANGKIDKDKDTDYKEWMSGITTLIGQETPGQRLNFVPDVEGFLSATE